MTGRNLSLVCLLALALTGCPETVSCPDGFAMPDGEDECVPLDGTDAGPRDAEPDAAGPCPTACTGMRPVCDEENGVCVQCDAEDDSACTGDTPICDVADNVCVGCMGDGDCSDPTAARCVSGMCVGCNDSGQCDGIEGLGVCEPGAGTCVQCTELDDSACGGNPCTSENTCSDYGTTQETCEPCDTDANCGTADHYCVPMRYDGMDRPGGYCLKDGAAAGGCQRPFTVPLSGRTSLSGETGLRYCGVNETNATCEAVRALLADESCSTDADCPEGGLCRTVGLTPDRCTYRCAGASECLQDPTAGSTCNEGTPPSGTDYCGG